jgi:ribosome biogenesis GTPase
MGKSTLTNALLPEVHARTAEISTSLDSGRHTTTHASLYHIDDSSQLIDSPGLQEFGLKHLEASQLIYYFPEMRGLVGKCRFHNCSHRAEPGCALKQATESGAIRPYRLGLLQRLMNELLQNK